MLTSLVFTVLAATATASFQEFAQTTGGNSFVLAESEGAASIDAYQTPYSQDPKGRQWEVANGQLRSGNGNCAYPAVGE